MTFETFLNTLALIVATVAALAGVGALIISIAGLPDEGRARLAQWTNAAAIRARRFVRVGFAFVGLLNGTLGVVIFSIDRAPLTRGAVLQLVLFLVNVAIGLYLVNKLVEERAARVAAEKAEVENLFIR